MTEREALYAALLAEPEEDAPRLIYADWLEEHPRSEADVARANFIRWEIEASLLPQESEERVRLESDAAILFNRFGTTWNLEIPTWDEWYDSSLIYERGFPYELRTVSRKLYFSGGKLFEAAPIRSLVVRAINGFQPWSDRLIQSVHGQLPDLSGILALSIGPNILLEGSSEGVRLVYQMATQYPSLRNLTHLTFSGNRIDDDSVRMLDRSLREAVYRDSLEVLDLSDNRIQANGATTLSVAVSLTGIRRLILTGNPLTPFAQRMLKNHFGDRVVF